MRMNSMRIWAYEHTLVQACPVTEAESDMVRSLQSAIASVIKPQARLTTSVSDGFQGTLSGYEANVTKLPSFGLG